MTTFSLKDYYDNLALSEEEKKKHLAQVKDLADELRLRQIAEEEMKQKQKRDEDEYSGGIPIPFMGWAKINEDIDREEREKMLREQMHIVADELYEAREIIAKQSEMLDLFQRFIKDQDLHGKWMFFVEDRKSV